MSNKYILLYKPYNYLSQFTPESDGDNCLSDIHGLPSDVYPAGRLDKDSEGLLLLTNDNKHKTNITSPKSSHNKTYIIAVEGTPNMNSLSFLENGITIRVNKKSYTCAPAVVKLLSGEPKEMKLPGKPIRFRKNIPVSYIEISITEGKNRQVRKMLAKIGHPVLRLIRTATGPYQLDGLQPGEWRYIQKNEIR